MANTKKLLAVLLTALMVFVSGCGLIEKKPEAIQKQNVAKVGNEYITRAQLDQLFSYIKENIMAQIPDLDENSQEGREYLEQQKRQLLDQMTDQLLLEQKASELKLFKDENEIDEEIKKVIDEQYRAGKSEDEFNKWISDLKLTTDLLNIFARYQVIGNRVYNEITKDEVVSDEEARDHYNLNQTEYTEKPSTMEVSHILVGKEDKELAKEIKDRLDKGEDFKALSDQYSTDDVAKANGGNLGEILYNDPNYDSTFVKAAMILNEGEVSNPVETQFGWHIIKVTKKTEYPVFPFDEVKDDIKEQLLSGKKDTKYNDTMTQWREGAGIKIYEENINNVK